MRWRLALTPPMCGVDNMALDEALLERAQASGEGVVRVYSWSAPTLSLGRNQVARGSYSANLATARGIAVVRRPTGGRALLHHREITYSVSAPVVPTESLRDTYDSINAALVESLHSLGADVEVAHARRRAPLPGIAPCFEQPSRGELTLGGRKLAGSAQYREGGAFLQHGSILVDDDQLLLRELSDVPLGEIPPAATLREVIGDATPSRFAVALFDVVRRRWDATATELSQSDPAFARMAELRAHYADDEWTWRR